MNTAVDTSVLLAIVKGELSAEAWMDRLIAEREHGVLLACEVVWAETLQYYHSRPAHRAAMEAFGVQYSPMTAASAALAGEMQKTYRIAGGQRSRILADFMVGAHAIEQADQLAACDDGFLRKYFHGLNIVGI